MRPSPVLLPLLMRLLCVVMALLFFLTACQQPEPGLPEPPPPAPIAEINGEPLYREDFETFLSFHHSENTTEIRPPKAAIFKDFLLQRLLLQKAKAKGTEPDPLQLESHLRDWVLPDGVDSSGREELVRDYLTIQAFLREQIADQLQVELRDVQNYYSDHEEEFVAQDRVHILEILTGSKEEAEQVHSSLEIGNISLFKETAKRVSTGVTAESGGDLGRFERGQLPHEFETIVFSLQPGEFSSVVESSHGYHIFLVEEKIPSHYLKFHEAQRTILEQMLAQKERYALDDYLKLLSAQASIRIYDQSLDSALEQP